MSIGSRALHLNSWFTEIIALSLFVFFVLLLAACAQPSAPAEQPTPSHTSPPPTNTSPPPTATATITPSPTPVPAGPRIVFTSNRGADPNKLDLYILDLETMEIAPLNTGLQPILPQWSPDGSKILFSVIDIWNLYTIGADGANLTQVTDFRSNNGDWSPDGSQIVFQSDHQNEPEDVPDLYRIDANGENLFEILDTPDVIDYSPRWSPVEDKIMFISRQTGKDEIFTIKVDGSELTKISDSGSPVTGAVWSPDGSRIAITFGGFGKTDLYVMDPDGISNVVRLTQNQSTNNSPSFSPDGKQIVFASSMSGSWELWMINVDGTNLVQLTDDVYLDAFPDWSP